MDMRQVETLIKEAEALKGKLAYVKGVSDGTMKELHRASAMLEVGIQMLKDDKDELVQNLAWRLSQSVMDNYEITKEMCIEVLKYTGQELMKYQNMADDPKTDKGVASVIDKHMQIIEQDISMLVATVTKCSRLEVPDGFTVGFNFYAPAASGMNTVRLLEVAIAKEMVTA